MISLHRLDGMPIMVNPDLIEFIEPIPDTVITLISGNKFIVREPTADVQHLILAYRRSVNERAIVGS